MNLAEKFITGVIGIGLVVAFAAHAGAIGTAAQGIGKAGGGLITSAEKG